MEIAKKLKELRENVGFTQKEIGLKTGKAYQTVASWESGKGQPDADIFMFLCELYGVTDILETFGYSGGSTALSVEDKKHIKKYHALDVHGKESVDLMLAHEYKRCESNEQNEFIKERSDYIKKHALPFASAGGDSSNLDEAQALYERAKGGQKNE